MLTKIQFAPGIDKQDTSVGAEGRWVDSDNVRFRYGLPEKVGGWQSLLTDTIVGVARKQHAFVDTDGNRYVALGTDKFLLCLLYTSPSPRDRTRSRMPSSA